MKKVQIYRRLKSLFEVIRDAFIEEEPREKARRAMQESSEELNRVIYQRLALEHESQSGNLDQESRMWCRENLKRLEESEQVMSGRLAALREQYRKLMMQDLFYKTLSDPGADSFEQAQSAIMELQSAVESERTLRSIPRFLEDKSGEAIPMPNTGEREPDVPADDVPADDDADEIVIDADEIEIEPSPSEQESNE